MIGQKAAIFISGVSSGFGRNFLESLNEDYLILGTVRTQELQLQLQMKYPEHRFYLMDLEHPATIDNAFDEIEKLLTSNGLFAMVNNAGMVQAGPVCELTRKDWLQQFETNLFGHIHCIRRAFPLLVKYGSDARIINLSSVSGIFASPFLGAYAASKFALEAVSDSLRRELLSQGIHVVLLQPGSFKTDIWYKNLGVADKFKEGSFYAQMKYADEIIQTNLIKSLPTQKLAAVLIKVLKSKRPKPRYLIHKHPLLFRIFAYLVPDRWKDNLVRRAMNKKNFRPI